MSQRMDEDIRQFVINALKEMNYDVSGVTGDTDLGPAGLDVESLSIAELALLVEDRFGVNFDEDDVDELSLMTLDEFAAEVAGRIAATAGSKSE